MNKASAPSRRTGEEQAGIAHDRQRRHGVSGDQQLEHLHPHPLARQPVEMRARCNAGGEPGRIGRAVAIGGMEAEEPQDAQMVLGDARRRRADEAHAP
jgi:hypothetical protein